MLWQSSEYVTGSKHATILNMQKLHKVLNIQQYCWICLNKTWICLNMSEFTIKERVLNMSSKIHSMRSLYKIMSTYWEMGVFRTLSKIGRFGKIIVALNYFCNTLYLKSLGEYWICIEFSVCQRSEYSRIVNMPGFWVSKVTQGLRIFENLAGFWICVGCNYGRVLSFPGSRICHSRGWDIWDRV